MSAYSCIKLNFLLTLNHDARNHESKISKPILSIYTAQFCRLGLCTIFYNLLIFDGEKVFIFERGGPSPFRYPRLLIQQYSQLPSIYKPRTHYARCERDPVGMDTLWHRSQHSAHHPASTHPSSLFLKYS